ncbi:long-chain fatty acid--CoA ligase [Rhodococcus rhodnii]|uniref:CoA ligase n=2 Tax=Rhodococcus rhodnii TaxID=38312 RepID=R7WQE3_9NOCA|nr:class I adenylate-forming enzyme family protein [Rhodococcus rhodnii]EOM77490.1 CoA ligase [Rhodococcus rhodnii LMG 5362]TXG90360.1 long-chain fatty acid--CoA ligase [Rhodococcus rhodnii]
MSAPPDPQAYLDQVITELTGPGGVFEVAEEDVLGARMPVMLGRRASVGELVRDSDAWGDRDYLVTRDARVSFAQHRAEVAALAAALRERHGVGRGDRVAILAANSPSWVTAFFATQVLGAIGVGMNAWWAAPEVRYGLEHSTPVVVFADAKRAAVLESLAGDGVLDGVTVLTLENDLPDLVAQYLGAPLDLATVDEDDPSTILYTSGTSGRPKGALHSHRNLLAVVDYHRYNDGLAAAFTGRRYEPTEPSELRYLLTSPLLHIASLHNLVVPRLATGSAVVMPEGGFDVDAVLSLVERERVTNWGAVPTMAARLLAHPDVEKYDLSSLRAFALASAPSSVAFKERLKERFAFARDALVDSYGLTECSTAIAAATGPELEYFPGTLGRPIITVSLEIRDPLGDWLPDGEEGEICVRSPFVMLGYWNDESATRAAIDDGRWLRTGDFGVVENGRLRLTGRRSDLILRGGENVYPTEIEQCLDEHPDVDEAAVVGVAHPELGNEVAAVVVVRDGASPNEADLRSFVESRLAYYKVPTRWRITSEPLPRNATGKIVRTRIEA